jgi:hypothetical protein
MMRLPVGRLAAAGASAAVTVKSPRALAGREISCQSTGCLTSWIG